MESARDPSQPHLTFRIEGRTLLLHLGGAWTLSAGAIPTPKEVAPLLERHPELDRIVIDGSAISAWDSRLLLFLIQLIETLPDRLALKRQNLPEGAERLLELALSRRHAPTPRRSVDGTSPLIRLGEGLLQWAAGALSWLAFLGEVVLATGQLLRGGTPFRQRDFWELFEGCGPRAVPIVTMIALLVGMVLAYVGALQLQMFGAQIFVADLVGIGMVREMGAMMTAVIMAGRTGASYAAQLGTMQVNEEIDALRTLAISPIESLVLPRLLALLFAVPLLTLYADVVGILGGAIAAVLVFDLSFLEYFSEMGRMVGIDDAMVGLIKSVVFGIWIALSGCLRGISCGRSAEAVGRSTTSAVVTAIVGIVVFDALLTILFTHLEL